jgi:hypothetical protein
MHDTALHIMSYYFKIHENSFKLVKPDSRLMSKLMIRFAGEKVFTCFDNGKTILKEEPDLFVFDNFIEGYHLLMLELSDLAVEAVNMVIPENDSTESIYITGGFSRNPLFQKLIASSFPDKKVWTSELGNTTALGAAAVALKAIYPEKEIVPDLGLNEVQL